MSAPEQVDTHEGGRPAALYVGALGSAAFVIAFACITRSLPFAALAIPYLLAFGDKDGDIGCAMGALGVLAGAALTLLLRGEPNWFLAPELFACQCCLVVGVWQMAHASGSDKTRGE